MAIIDDFKDIASRMRGGKRFGEKEEVKDIDFAQVPDMTDVYKSLNEYYEAWRRTYAMPDELMGKEIPAENCIWSKPGNTTFEYSVMQDPNSWDLSEVGAGVDALWSYADLSEDEPLLSARLVDGKVTVETANKVFQWSDGVWWRIGDFSSEPDQD